MHCNTVENVKIYRRIFGRNLYQLASQNAISRKNGLILGANSFCFRSEMGSGWLKPSSLRYRTNRQIYIHKNVQNISRNAKIIGEKRTSHLSEEGPSKNERMRNTLKATRSLESVSKTRERAKHDSRYMTFFSISCTKQPKCLPFSGDF